MAVALAPKQPRELMAKEKRAQLIGEPAPSFHGTLTGQLHRILERADPSRETVGDLERALKEVFEDHIAVKVSDVTRGQLVLTDGALRTSASELLARLAERPAREIIAGLEEVIARREQQGDYWPEGRLNLGIAYACLGEYQDAKRWLEDAVNMLKYPSYIPRSEQMAA